MLLDQSNIASSILLSLPDAHCALNWYHGGQIFIRGEYVYNLQQAFIIAIFQLRELGPLYQFSIVCQLVSGVGV